MPSEIPRRALTDETKQRTVRTKLIRWWAGSRFDTGYFPWRSAGISPYRALITEVLLQRTRAEAVQKIYRSFFRKFPSPRKLHSAPAGEIRKAINSLGLHWRAEKLKELGGAIAGGIPDNTDDLIRLPGVGIYAAGAYLSLHRKRRAIIPDANMARVTGRIFGFKVHPETRRDKSFLSLCEQITPRRKYREFNYAIIDFGRFICKPPNPLCQRCFLNRYCEYWISSGRVAEPA